MEIVKPVYSSAFVIALSFSLVCCQYARSPCPGIFDYESDESGIYGKIVLSPRNGQPTSQIVVQINFTVATQLFSNYYGNLQVENERFALQNYNRGSPMKYRVNFPVTSPLPRCTSLTVNGNTICYGPGGNTWYDDVLRPNTYITTFSLQHTAFIRGGGGQVYIPPNQNQQSNLVTDFGENTHVYNFNFDPWDNSNFGYFPNDIVTTSRHPIYQTSKPSNPFYGNKNPDDPNSSQTQFNRPNKPVYQQPTQPTTQQPPLPPPRQPTRPPVYEPATKPVEVYYPPEETTQAPWQYTTQSTTQRPVQQPTSVASNTECGVNGNVVPLVHQGSSYNRGVLPWLVAIYKNKESTLTFACGGTLVSERHVITAAHCMQQRKQLFSFKDIFVKVGVFDLDAWDDEYTMIMTLISATIHELYNATTLENDIAVLTFKQRVTYNMYIRPACLWNGDTDIDKVAGTTGVIAGWGEQTSGGGLPNTPHMVYLPIANTETCRASTPKLHEITYSTTLCAGDRRGSGPCKGDSGGGLYILDRGRWRLRGIVSKALRQDDGSCNLDEYVVFTDSAKYLPWIRQIMTQHFYD